MNHDSIINGKCRSVSVVRSEGAGAGGAVRQPWGAREQGTTLAYNEL